MPLLGRARKQLFTEMDETSLSESKDAHDSKNIVVSLWKLIFNIVIWTTVSNGKE